MIEVTIFADIHIGDIHVSESSGGLAQATRDMMYWLHKALFRDERGRTKLLPDIIHPLDVDRLHHREPLKHSVARKNEFELARMLLRLCEVHNGRLRTLSVNYADPESLKWLSVTMSIEVTGPVSRRFNGQRPPLE